MATLARRNSGRRVNATRRRRLNWLVVAYRRTAPSPTLTLFLGWTMVRVKRNRSISLTLMSPVVIVVRKPLLITLG